MYFMDSIFMLLTSQMPESHFYVCMSMHSLTQSHCKTTPGQRNRQCSA